MTITLARLLKDIMPLPASLDVPCQGLTLDSRTLKKGDVFFALSGTQQQGHAFVQDALRKGAAAILIDTTATSHIDTLDHTPCLSIQDLHKKLGMIASRFYQHPEHALSLIGITGTNGKTSCSHFIADALHHHGHPCGIIGTLGYGLYGQLRPLSHTTPDIFTLYRLLAELRDKGAKTVVMEVSSHALKQARIQGLTFKIGLFTNLTQDHLDYHGTLADYAACKRTLFEDYPLSYAIINHDDLYGQQWLHTLKHIETFTYSLQNKALSSTHAVQAQHFSIDIQGIKAGLKTPWGEGVLHSHLIGQFNLYNLLATLTALGIYQLPLSDILNYLSKLHPVPGRMEKIGGQGQPLVIVDYAHTPDALQKTLSLLKDYCAGELWCVFGCGGNRDSSKRPLMGAIAEQYANNILITDDNPRFEEAKNIAQDILAGFQDPAKATIEHDRRRAIFHAVSCAQQEDIILIAGKGHECHQQVGDKKNPFSDHIEAKLALENRIEKL